MPDRPHNRAPVSTSRRPAPLRLRRRRGSGRRALVGLAAAVLAGVATAVPPAFAGLAGALPDLTRAPYLTDVTSSSVTVTWATTTQTRGIVRYGQPGQCDATSVQSTALGTPITVNGVREYQSSVTVDGLTPGTEYCYRVLSGETPPKDLLGTAPTPSVTTLDTPGSTAPLTFAVLGDWGDTTNSGVNDGTLNANQAAIDALIAASGSRFAVSTGDTAYPNGSQTNYGDLNQTGPNISAVFGPSYWAAPGQTTPLFVTTGNHGRNATFLSTWPQPRTAAGGVYSQVAYPSINGSTPATYPTSYYAFSTAGVRFYVLDAAWSNSNLGNSTGGPCGSHCRMYEMDRDAHWTTSSAQFQWLQADLAAHPGGLKMAFFHFPLRSDDPGQPGDAYLAVNPGTGGSVEQLLRDGGVQLVFNGHAHNYQRHVAPPGGVTSYVSGGGGGRATPISSKCSPGDAYAVGWSYATPKGSACGAAAKPTTDAQVFHFLKVAVDGTRVTVTPVNAQGTTFDVQTYDLRADSSQPTAPGSLAAARTGTGGTKAALTWTPASDNVGVSAYDVYRNGTWLAAVPGTATSWTDPAVSAGSAYTYRVEARDLAGNTRAASVVLPGGGATDTTPPSVPTGLTATPASHTSIGLSWAPSTDAVGVTGYTVLRAGTPIATVTTTSFTDTNLLPGTDYGYQVRAQDAAGNVSAPSATASATTLADTVAPTAPGTPTVTSATATAVGLSWAASSDDVGVVRYDVLRDGAVVGTAAGTTFTDTTVSPGTTYAYAVRAYDAADNGSTGSTRTVTTPATGAIFGDGFESGDLGAWTTVTGLTTQSALVHTGSFAARETSTGTPTYAYRTVPGATELWAQVWVNAAAFSTSANLFGFRAASGGSIVNLYVDSARRVSLRNNVGFVTTNSTTLVPMGTWHRFVLHAVVAGTSSSVDVSMDGTPVPGLSLTGQNLGTSPIGRLQLGETGTGRTYDIAFDDVAVAPSPL